MRLGVRIWSRGRVLRLGESSWVWLGCGWIVKWDFVVDDLLSQRSPGKISHHKSFPLPSTIHCSEKVKKETYLSIIPTRALRFDPKAPFEKLGDRAAGTTSLALSRSIVSVVIDIPFHFNLFCTVIAGRLSVSLLALALALALAWTDIRGLALTLLLTCLLDVLYIFLFLIHRRTRMDIIHRNVPVPILLAIRIRISPLLLIPEIVLRFRKSEVCFSILANVGVIWTAIRGSVRGRGRVGR